MIDEFVKTFQENTKAILTSFFYTESDGKKDSVRFTLSESSKDYEIYLNNQEGYLIKDGVKTVFDSVELVLTEDFIFIDQFKDGKLINSTPFLRNKK